MAIKKTVNTEEVGATADGLVALTNGVDTIRAHPDQLALWIKQGWQVVE